MQVARSELPAGSCAQFPWAPSVDTLESVRDEVALDALLDELVFEVGVSPLSRHPLRASVIKDKLCQRFECENRFAQIDFMMPNEPHLLY